MLTRHFSGCNGLLRGVWLPTAALVEYDPEDTLDDEFDDTVVVLGKFDEALVDELDNVCSISNGPPLLGCGAIFRNFDGKNSNNPRSNYMQQASPRNCRKHEQKKKNANKRLLLHLGIMI